MGKVAADISVSLDGFITGPNDNWSNRWARAGSGSTSGFDVAQGWGDN